MVKTQKGSPVVYASAECYCLWTIWHWIYFTFNLFLDEPNVVILLPPPELLRIRHSQSAKQHQEHFKETLEEQPNIPPHNRLPDIIFVL